MTEQELRDYVVDKLIAVSGDLVSDVDIKDTALAIIDFIVQNSKADIADWEDGPTSYDTGDLVQHNLRIWKSKVDGNIGNEPPTDGVTTETTEWIEVSSSSNLREWAAGIYGSGLVIVYHENQWWKLNVATRPFESTNIVTEIAAGDWIPFANPRKYWGEVGDQTAMLALTNAQSGDWVTRTDNGFDYELTVNDPETLANWKVLSPGKKTEREIKLGDEETELAAGTLIYNWRLPFDADFSLPEFNCRPDDVPTGSTTIFDIQLNGVSIFSTKPTVDDGEDTSSTAATPAVLSTTEGSAGDNLTVICDQAGSTNGGSGWDLYFPMTRK